MTLEEAYRACALERYSTSELRTGDKVAVTDEGAWVEMHLLIPAWVLGHGYTIGLRETWETQADPEDVARHQDTSGRYALWDEAYPAEPLLAEDYEDLIQQLQS